MSKKHKFHRKHKNIPTVAVNSLVTNNEQIKEEVKLTNNTPTITVKNTLETACSFAIAKLNGQTRKSSNIPAFFHGIGVAKRALSYEEVTELTTDEFQTACIIHDTREDSDATFEEIEKSFGKNVAETVEEVSFLKNNHTAQDKFDNFKLLIGKKKSSIVLKLADRMENVLDFLHNPETAWYASKYALLGYPIYRAYLSLEGANNPRIVADIALIETIIRRRYMVSIFTSSMEQIEDVLFNEKTKVN